MQHSLRFLTYLLLIGVLALAGLAPARASHIMGGQMTYRYVSGDTYEVTVSFYRDCTGINLPTGAITIMARQACNSSASVTGTLSPVLGTNTTGTGYCPAIQALATCNPVQYNYPNYEKQDYRGTIVLPPAATWIISYDDCCRPSTGNIPTQDNFCFEATLNNLVTVNGVPTRINNSSPEFSSRDIPVPFVMVNQPSSINFTAAAEADGDSLVYSLDRPLSTCGVYNDYAPRLLTPVCASGQLPGAPGTTCLLNCGPAQPLNYTADLPLPVAVDTIGICGTVAGVVYTKTVRPRFLLNVSNGQITLTPNVLRPGNAALGYNKYVVVGKITEYRRLPGSNRRYLVGSVRRDFLVIIAECVGNTVPNPPVVTNHDPLAGALNTNTPDTTRITIYACSYTQARLPFTDPDNVTTATHPAVSPLQNLTVTYTGAGTINFNQLQNGDIGTFALLGNGTPSPEMRFYLQPSSSYAGQIVRIPVRIEDNACPIKGVQNRVIEIRIVRGNRLGIQIGASGSVAPQTTICAGETLTLTSQVSRPDSVRRLATNSTQAQTYAYQWRTLAGANLPAVTTNTSIAVAPTQTTRYYLTVAPVLGFAQGLCTDTTSVLVRVMPRPAAPTVSRVGNALVSSEPTGNQWYRNNTAIAGATAQSLVPNVVGTYALTASIGPGPTQCTSALSAPTLVATADRPAAAGTSLHLAPNPTPDGRVNVQLLGYRQATTLALFDVLGRPVHTARLAAPDARSTTYPLDLGPLPAGVYVLRVSTAGGVAVCRIVRE